MKTLNIMVSDEDHRFLVNYKLENNLKRLNDAISEIIKKMKGGNK